MLSERINKIEASKTTVATDRARQLQREGKDVISLTVGESDFSTPTFILDAVNEAMYAGKGHHYTPVGGMPELLETIHEYHWREDQTAYESDEILVANGCKSIIYYALQTLINPGDEVLIPSPYWVSYLEQVKLAEGVPVIVQTDPEQNYALTEDLLEKHTTDKTKVLLLNYPNNPSGTVLTLEELEIIGNFCVKQDITIISDEIYNKLIFDDADRLSIASVSEEIKAQSLVVNGVSKAFAMTGWRIGYALGDKEIIAGMTKLASHASGNPSGISQYAAMAALNGPEEEIEEMRVVFSKRLDNAYDKLQEIPGFTLPIKPQGAFYLFPDCNEAARITHCQSVDDFVIKLIEEAGVAVVPGSAFGMPEHIRFSYATSVDKFNEAVSRIQKMMQKYL